MWVMFAFSILNATRNSIEETTAASTPACEVWWRLSPQALPKLGTMLPFSRFLAAPPSSMNPWGCFLQSSPLSSLCLDPKTPLLPSSSPGKLECVVLVTHARVFALLPGESWKCCTFSCCLSEKGTEGPFAEKKGKKNRQTPGYRTASAGFGPAGIVDNRLY